MDDSIEHLMVETNMMFQDIFEEVDSIDKVLTLSKKQKKQFLEILTSGFLNFDPIEEYTEYMYPFNGDFIKLNTAFFTQHNIDFIDTFINHTLHPFFVSVIEL